MTSGTRSPIPRVRLVVARRRNRALNRRRGRSMLQHRAANDMKNAEANHRDRDQEFRVVRHRSARSLQFRWSNICRHLIRLLFMRSLENPPQIIFTAALSKMLRPADDLGRLNAPRVMQGVDQPREIASTDRYGIDCRRLWGGLPERRIMSNSHRRLQLLSTIQSRSRDSHTAKRSPVSFLTVTEINNSPDYRVLRMEEAYGLKWPAPGKTGLADQWSPATFLKVAS
jgi:hypothetical protein